MYLDSLKAAIDSCGGQQKLAQAINSHLSQSDEIHQYNICKWVQLGRVPGKWVLKVEQASGVPCWELRPDLYPPERFRQAA